MDRSFPAVFQKNKQEIIPTGSFLSGISTRPGVYLYKDSHRNILYVGKAKNLRVRISQYFVHHDALGVKTGVLVPQISVIQTIATDSEFDALILESFLIRTHKPKYNSIAKDDKSPLFIVVTLDESLPRIFFTRGKTIDSQTPLPAKRFIAGPFQSGAVARRLLQSIRHAIPYCSQKQRTGRACFYTHLGLCGPCPSMISGMAAGPEKTRLVGRYRRRLRLITYILSGRVRNARRNLEGQMRRYSRDQKYEEAGVVKQQLDALNRLATRTFDPGIYLSRAGVEGDMYAERLAHLSRVLRQYGIGTSFFRRIECIDISTLQGAWSTGSLVVFTDGIPDTSRYRRFRIRRDGKPNDVAMIAQIVTRRFAHPEWSLPDVFIVDGGKPQIHAAKQAMQATPATQKIPVIGLAKRFEELIVPVSVTPGLTRDRASYSFKTIRLPPSSPAIQLVRHIRDEAHRFAKTYHTVLRGKFFAN